MKLLEITISSLFIMSTVFSVNSPGDDEPKTTSQPSVASSLKQEEASERLKTFLKEQKPQVFKLLEQYKNKYKKPWGGQKRLEDGYSKLEQEISPEEVYALTRDIYLLKGQEARKSLSSDKDFFQVVYDMSLYAGDDLCFYYFDLLPSFQEFVEPQMGPLIELLEKKQSPLTRNLLRRLPLSKKTKEKYKSFLEKQIQISKKEYRERIKENPKKLLAINIFHLSECAYLGDPDSTQKLISLYKNLNGEGKGYSDFIYATKKLLELGTRECVIAVLERFRENIAAPKYRVGRSPRFIILRELYLKYPDDVFFESYRQYLGETYSYQVLDSSIGGEDGVKKMYEGFKVWVKKRYDYDLNLQDVDFKIKLTPLLRTY